MKARQKQVIDMIVRVRAFLATQPAIDPASYAVALAALDGVIRQLREYAGAQLSGWTLKRAQLEKAEKIARRLMDWHIRPLVTIAEALSADGEPMPRLVQPPGDITFTRLIAAVDAVVDSARPFEAQFIEAGRPADFLAQLAAARAELERTLGDRAEERGKHIGATVGIAVQIRKARAAVKRLDALVRIAYEGNVVMLERWKAAKKVFAVPAASTARAAAESHPDISPAKTAA